MNASLLLRPLLGRLGLLFTFSAVGAVAAPTAAPSSNIATTFTPDAGHLVIDAKGVPPPPPLFFSATVDQTIRPGLTEITGEATVRIRVLQGKPELFTLGLAGEGEIVEVTGKGLLDWAVRRPLTLAPNITATTPVPPSRRLLDLRPVLTAGVADPQDFEFTVRTRHTRVPPLNAASLLLVTPGSAAGFGSQVTVQPDATVEVRVTAAIGFVPLGENAATATRRFFAAGDGQITVSLAPRGAAVVEAELLAAQLTGRVADPATSVAFRLKAQFRVAKAGARLRLLEGQAALNDRAAGDGWHAELVPLPDGTAAYELVGERAGTFALDLPFVAAVREDGDWRALSFAMPAGSVVPLTLDGLNADFSFNPDLPLLPVATAQGWAGFLPADGRASLAWKRTREKTEGALFFTSFEKSEVRLGAGLLRQDAELTFRVLQGKLGGVRCKLEGPGEILGVEGANVVGWKVVPADGGRMLEVRFSRPVETEGTLTVRSQTELGGFPVRAEPLRLLPENVVRHSGYLRIANRGAVRLETTDVSGLMQLAPGQFPGAMSDQDARQIFVYRFPSATYGYRVLASQIQPEVGVSAITTYELTETDRVINASLELDVREAPLRDWTWRIPADYTVVSVTGADVADYVAESAATDGYRSLKVLFGKPVDGRQLLQVRLEKNQPAAAGDWALPALRFPDAKTVRGHVGALSSPGYRLVPASVDRLVEVPLSYFPNQVAGLQQAWRLREAGWTATVRIEALGQSIQADAFHLYSIKEGAIYGSVLLNYFVVGAPATEWRVEVPAGVGNIDVTGQNVRRDWRREGNQLIVTLHQPVLGAATLLITFEQPMSARGGSIHPGEVRPLGVQSERGYVEVVSPLQVKHAVKESSGGLLKLEATELPAEYRLLTTSPALAVYQYTNRPFSLELGLEWYAPGETVDQVVDFAKLSSQISRDGQVVTDVRYFVKTRGRKALRLQLPEGVKLWEARVDNEMTNARIDGDQTLIPLPAKLNVNEPVAVTLRLGQPATAGSLVRLFAPRTSATTVINEWTLHSDEGFLLVPQGGNAAVTKPAVTETGFEWISARSPQPFVLLFGLIALSALLLRSWYGWKIGVGLLCAAVAAFFALKLAGTAAAQRHVNTQEIAYAATIVPANEPVAIVVANVRDWRAMVTWWGALAVLAGAVALIPGLRSQGNLRLVAIPAALAAIAAGLLAQPAGAAYFFGATALAICFLLIGPVLRRWRNDRDAGPDLPPAAPTEPTVPPAPLVSAGTASLLAVALLVGGSLTATPDLRAQAAQLMPLPRPAPWLGEGDKSAQSIIQTWSIRENRLFAEIEITVRGGPGDSFLLLRDPALLTEFKGDGLRLGKAVRDGRTAYFVAPEREGLLTARAKFEMPVSADRASGIILPTGPAATQRVAIELDQGGWEFVSPLAMQVLPATGLGDNRSGATLVLAPHGTAVIRLQPKGRDLATEAVQFFAEASHLFLPGPGVVNGLSRFTVRPVQGRVTELDLDVPAGLTVGDVVRGPVGAWRFDPVKRRLHVALEPAQTGTFRFDVETQLGAGALPFDLTLEPIRVPGAAGEVGKLALAFGGDAQPESVQPAGLSPINVQDFEPGLVPADRNGRAFATVQHVWRYGQAGGKVSLKVAAVAPEVRVTGRQVISLDDDRLVMAADLNVSITRVGLFKLSFVLPAGLEVESLSGPALNQWTEAQEGSQRIVTLHLNGRTLGEQAFALTLAGAAPAAQAAWPVPALNLREATRQTGEVLIVPGRGLRLRAVDREKVTPVDPRTVGGLQPGTLAFQLLQEDWKLTLGIEALEPWITVQALHEVTIREGQTLTRLGLRCRVDNAAVKHFRVKLPGLGEDRARTVRAIGPAVSDIVRVAGGADLWEIRFQRGIAGETDVVIEFQGPAGGEQNRETVAPVEFPGARQTALFVAVRAGGRLELDAAQPGRGWSRADWSAVPAALQNRGDRSVPALCFRVAEPEGPLAVNVRRHDVAEALKLRVTEGGLTTVFSARGGFLTAVDLKVDVLDKSTLRVRLPEGASLYNTLVNGETVSAVREGDAYLFHVSPSTGDGRSAAVRLVYAAPGATSRGTVSLAGPSLNVPLENVVWRVVIPPGYELEDYEGGLRLRQDYYGAKFGLAEYESSIVSKRSASARQAEALLKEANSWLERGDQQKASEALSRVSNAPALDAAANEDARVQLRNLKTQQTVVGLNTRRQKLYLDNRAEGARNEQLEQAASLNPLLQNKLNFNAQEMDQLLMGNTADENTALKGIAARLVDQQLTAEPAPGAIDVTLTENGRVLTFTRSLQVDGTAPLELRLEVAAASRASLRAIVLLLAAVAALAAIPLIRRREA